MNALLVYYFQHGDSSKQENDDGLFGTGAIVVCILIYFDIKNPLSFEQVDITTGAAGSKHDFTIRSSHAYDFSDEEEANSHRSNLKDASIPENGTDFHLVQQILKLHGFM